MASLDVKTAFDVANPSVVAKILSLIGTHCHVVAALLAEMQDVKGSARFENCGDGIFVTPSASGREEWRHQCCGGGWLSTYFGKLKKDGKPEDGDCHFGRNLTASTYCAVLCGRTTIGYSATIVRYWSIW